MLKIDQRVHNILDSFRLTKTEKQLYLTGLTKPGATVSDLIESTGVNRTTAYHALSTLQQKGFVSEARHQGRLIYDMAKPDELGAHLDRKHAAIESQRQLLAEIAPLFPTTSSESLTRTLVEKFEGLEGVKEAVDRALYCKNRKWRIIAPRDNFFSQVGSDYAEYFMSTRRSRGIKARSLWEPSAKASNLSLRDLFERHPRYLPNQLVGRFKSVIILFDDKALFISSANSLSAVIVGSEELVSTLTVMYDGLWSLAQKPNASR